MNVLRVVGLSLLPRLVLPALVSTPDHIVHVSDAAGMRVQSDTVPAPQLTTITTDTGAFAPGRHDFTHYTLPTFCRSAAINARYEARRTIAMLTLADTQVVDTVGLGAAARVARACGARFTLANTPTWARSDLFDLAVYEQNDSLAQTILADHPEMWEGGMQQFLHFGRLSAARALLAQADAKGPAMRSLQLALHAQWRVLYQNQDTAWGRLAHEDTVLIQRGLQHKKGDPGYGYVLEGYRDLMRHALRYDTAAMSALALAGKRDLGKFSLSDQPPDLNAMAGQVGSQIGIHITKSSYDYQRDRGDWETFSLDTMISRLAPSWYAHLRYGGQHASRLGAEFWWPQPGTAAGAPVIPVPGKVNLICGGGVPTNAEPDVFNGHQMLSAYRQAEYLKQWLAEYGKAGLAVTIVRPADGAPYIWYRPDRYADYITVTDSADEAQFWRWYDQVYHQLPVAEAVNVVHATHRLPPQDGRWLTLAENAPNGYVDLLGEAIQVHGGNLASHALEEASVCTLVGRDGTLLYRHDDKRQNYDWEGWGEVLAWLFPGVHPAPAVPHQPSTVQPASARDSVSVHPLLP